MNSDTRGAIANIAPAFARPSAAAGSPTFSPLYQQIKGLITQGLEAGEWKPGDMIPSEIELAARFKVSQGTVRKAVDELAAEHLLVRRQGKGTFVAQYDEARVLFQFFKLKPDDDTARYPDSSILSVSDGVADEEERRYLDLAQGAGVLRIRRVRSFDGKPLVYEVIVLPEALFRGFETEPLPQNFYDTYAKRFGVIIAGGHEKMKAVAASAEQAGALQVAEGTPLLVVERFAAAFDGVPVEWRISAHVTEGWHYVRALG